MKYMHSVTGTSKKAIVLAIICTLFTSLGQLSWKLGVGKIDFAHWQTLLNFFFLLGFFLYGLGFLLLVRALKEGELTVVFPIVATSYVWVSLFSPLLFPSDHMNLLKWIGVGVILLSVLFLSGSVKKETTNERKTEIKKEHTKNMTNGVEVQDA
ncbi:EamA family transporter [Candidatus Woesearchaeota archaeon]|nr:EamA family transporter [Candidatus Woesearchaeota archaeon]